jgi:hypothetical protein
MSRPGDSSNKFDADNAVLDRVGPACDSAFAGQLLVDHDD